MDERRSITVRVDEQGALLDVDIPGDYRPTTLVETVRSTPIAPFLLDEFKEGGRCWSPNGG